MKFGDMNDFNYKNNSLFILYTKPDENIKITMKNLEIGRNNQTIQIKKIPINIDL